MLHLFIQIIELCIEINERLPASITAPPLPFIKKPTKLFIVDHTMPARGTGVEGLFDLLTFCIRMKQRKIKYMLRSIKTGFL